MNHKGWWMLIVLLVSGPVVPARAQGGPGEFTKARPIGTKTEGPKGSASTSCTLEYQRADDMWRAAPNLGWETITVPAGQSKTLITDWAYEKMRNDGIRYYGSHLRIVTNKGTRAVQLGLKTQLLWDFPVLRPGESANFKADLRQVWCE